MQMTVNNLPAEHRKQYGISIGVVISRIVPSSMGETIPLVDFGSGGVVRCKRCRTYINPCLTWVDNGRRWCCNLCGSAKDGKKTVGMTSVL